MSEIKRTNKIDESKTLKELFAGEIPIKEEITNIPSPKEKIQLPPEKEDLRLSRQVESLSSEKKNANDTDFGKSPKRKKPKASYEQLFLCKPIITNRRHTSVIFNELNHKNILQILKMVDGISMTSFINNLLAYHFEEFGDEIEDLFQKFIEKSTKLQRD